MVVVRLLTFLIRTSSFLAISVAPALADSLHQIGVLAGGVENCFKSAPNHPTESALTIAAPFVSDFAKQVATRAVDVARFYVDQKLQAEGDTFDLVISSGHFYTAVEQNRKWRTHPALACIVVGRGVVGAIDRSAGYLHTWLSDEQRKFFTSDEGQAADYPILQAMGFRDVPDLYLEVLVEVDEAGAVFRLRPRAFYYRRDSNIPVDRAPKSIDLTFTFNKPADSTPFASFPMHIGLDQSVEQIGLQNVAADDPWARMPPPPDARDLSPDAKAALSTIPVFPFNLTVTIKQTRQLQEYLQMIGVFLKGPVSLPEKSTTP